MSVCVREIHCESLHTVNPKETSIKRSNIFGNKTTLIYYARNDPDLRQLPSVNLGTYRLIVLPSWQTLVEYNCKKTGARSRREDKNPQLDIWTEGVLTPVL